MVLAAELATIGWVSARMLATRRGGHTGSVNASSIPHDLVVLAQLSKDCLMDPLPNAGLYPFVEPAPTSHATAQPSSRGRYSHGIPVLSTNRIPVRVAKRKAWSGTMRAG